MVCSKDASPEESSGLTTKCTETSPSEKLLPLLQMVTTLSLHKDSLLMSLTEVSEPTPSHKSFMSLGIPSTNIVCELLIPLI